MLPIVLAACSALVWGTGDFCGGKATQRSNALAVTLVSQIAGLPALTLFVVLAGGGQLTGRALFTGALAGVAGFVGIVLLYRGLAQGAMAIFAPVTAVTAAVVPLAVGLLTQRPPGGVQLVGACCAIVAVALVSMTGASHTPVTMRLIGLALASGTMFGIFFAVLGRAGTAAGIWPLVGVRAGSLTVGLVVVLATRTALRLAPKPLRWAAVAGIFDVLANGLYVLAAAHGPLAIVAPIAALYPVSTVLLALGVDRERVHPIQLAGLGLAAASLVLVAT